MPTYKAEWWDSYYCGKCHKMFLVQPDREKLEFPSKNYPDNCPYCGSRPSSLKETTGRLVINPKDVWGLNDDLLFEPVENKTKVAP